MDYRIGSFDHLAAVIKERDQLQHELTQYQKKFDDLSLINKKLDILIDAIGFRLPFAQKGEEDYGRQKESDRSRIESSSPGQT